MQIDFIENATILEVIIGFNCNKKNNKIGVTQCLDFVDALNLMKCSKYLHRYVDLPKNMMIKIKELDGFDTIHRIPYSKREYIGKVFLSQCASDAVWIERIIGLYPNLTELDLDGWIYLIQKYLITLT
jgi:hypothetical protein